MTLGFCLRPLFTYLSILFSNAFENLRLSRSVCMLPSICPYCVGAVVRILFIWSRHFSTSRHLFLLIWWLCLCLCYPACVYRFCFISFGGIRYGVRTRLEIKTNWLFRKKVVSLDSITQHWVTHSFHRAVAHYSQFLSLSVSLSLSLPSNTNWNHSSAIDKNIQDIL